MKIPKARKLPSGTWRIQLRLGGESININARTEKECVRLAQITKAEYLAGKRQASPDPESEPQQLPTLREAIDSYIDSRSNTLSPATLRGYDIVKRNRFKALMDRPLDQISDGDLIAAVNAEAALCSAKTLKNAWGLVCPAIKQATGRELPEVSLPQVVPKERTFLDAAEIQSFLTAVKGHPYEIPFLLALSSLRMSEIMALRWEDVDLKHKRIRVSGAAVPGRDHKLVRKPETKNRSSTRYVPILMEQLQAALEAAQEAGKPVVGTRRELTLRDSLARLCAKEKLPPVTMHGLRHSFASLAYHLQVPEQVTMEIGGWSDYGTMRRIYTHIAQSDVKRYEDAFAGFFSGKNAHENAHIENVPLSP